MVNYSNVSARAMIVNLHISLWSARKYNRSVSDEIAEDKQAAKNAGRYNTHLLAGSATHKAILTRAGEAFREHYAQTLPWGDNGDRLLPTANYFTYTDAMRRRQAAFDEAVDDFVDAYPRLRDEASVRLGRLYRHDDFPHPYDVRRKFAWAVDVSPVPTAGDIRVDLPADQIAAIETTLTQRAEQATRDAMEEAWSRLHEAVARIRRASGKDGVVRSTLIDHARETVDMLGRLNIAQDENLDRMRSRVEAELTAVSIEDLRKDDGVRADTEQRAAKIMQAMSAFYAPSK